MTKKRLERKGSSMLSQLKPLRILRKAELCFLPIWCNKGVKSILILILENTDKPYFLNLH